MVDKNQQDIMDSLVQTLFLSCEIQPEQQEKILSLLSPLKEKEHGKEHFYHSIRVGVQAYSIGTILMPGKEKALFYAGLLHDIGKAQVPSEILAKVSNSKLEWTAGDAKVMEKHVITGFEKLDGIFSYTASIIVRHHRFQPNCYPEIVPKSKIIFSKKTADEFDRLGYLLAIADCYDALGRVNSATNGEKLTDAQKQKEMFRRFPDSGKELWKLAKGGVFPWPA